MHSSAPGQAPFPTFSNPGHVGIYLRNDQMIQAPQSGQGVDIVDISQSFAGGFVGGGPVSGPGVTAGQDSLPSTSSIPRASGRSRAICSKSSWTTNWLRGASRARS